MKKLLNKMVSMIVAVAVFSISVLPVSAAELRIAVIQCDGTFFDTPQIISVQNEEHSILLNMKVKMPYTYTFSSQKTYSASASVTNGVDLTLGEIITIGNSVSVTLDTSVTFAESHSILYDEPGYRYVKPALFTQYTYVRVPVHQEISDGVCALNPTNTTIKYPTDFVLDGYYYTY